MVQMTCRLTLADIDAATKSPDGVGTLTFNASINLPSVQKNYRSEQWEVGRNTDSVTSTNITAPVFFGQGQYFYNLYLWLSL